MRILADSLRKFIDKASVNGSINTLLLECKNDGMVCNVRCEDNITLTNSILKKSAFAKYEEGMKWYVKSAKTLLSKLSMLPSTEAEVSLQGNMMVISASKDGKVMTISDGVGSADIIENVMSDEEMENLSKKFDGGNKIDKQTTQMWMKAISVMGSGKTKIEVKDKKLSMVNPNDLKEEASLTIDFDYKDVSTAMNAEVLSGILNALKDEEINVSIMRTNAPIQFKVSNEQMIVRIIQAPIVGDDEEEKAKEEKKGADKDE